MSLYPISLWPTSILPSHLCLDFKVVISFTFSSQHPVYIYLLSHVCAPWPTHLILLQFFSANNIQHILYIINLLVIKFSQTTCYFWLLDPNSSLTMQHARRFCILHNTASIYLSYRTVAMGETEQVKIQTSHKILLRYYKVFQPSITKHSRQPNVSNYIPYFSHRLLQEPYGNLHLHKIIYTGQADIVTLT